jgi:hypothetical protein
MSNKTFSQVFHTKPSLPDISQPTKKQKTEQVSTPELSDTVKDSDECLGFSSEEEEKCPPPKKIEYFTAKADKPIKKYKPEADPDTITVITMDFPERCDPQKTKRKYRIRIRYIHQTPMGNVERKRTITFGNVDQPDFIDTRDPVVKARVRSSLRAYDSPLKPNFYRLNLLNWGEEKQENLLGIAYLHLRHKLGLLQ